MPFTPHRAVLEGIRDHQLSKAADAERSEDAGIRSFAPKHRHVAAEIEDVIRAAFPSERRQTSRL